MQQTTPHADAAEASRPASPSLAEIAGAIAEQIKVEQELSSRRLNWNLTFQGFMIASYALVATAERYEAAHPWIQLVIVSAGAFVSWYTLKGLRASWGQRDFVKSFWSDDLEASGIPRPFSKGPVSVDGRLPARRICEIIVGMWVLLGVTTVLLTLTEHNPQADGTKAADSAHAGVEQVAPGPIDAEAEALAAPAPEAPAPASIEIDPPEAEDAPPR